MQLISKKKPLFFIRMTSLILLLAIMSSLNHCKAPQFLEKNNPSTQVIIPRIADMPNQPSPYRYRDWEQTALAFDDYVFDFQPDGDQKPMIWWDNAGRNFPSKTFGFYTAFGDVRFGPQVNNGENHEALAALGAVLGATMVGIDKSNQDGENYVSMMKNYFNKDNGWNVIMNFTSKSAHVGGGYGNDFWYEVHNNVLFYALGHFYPQTKDFDTIMRTIANQFYLSDSVMGDSYSYSYFDFKEMKGYKNHIPTQEDVAGGYAFIFYAAWIKYQDPKYLKAAKNAIDVLYNQKENRFYEAMMPIAAQIAARLNAEQGTNYDVSRFLNWTFDGDAVGREGWGVLATKFGNYDVSGLAGSTVHNGGYGFLMNTFDLILPLTVLVRYDQSYSNMVGKWVLNASNAARFCYDFEMPDSLQALPNMRSLTKGVIAYEGIIRESSYDEFKGITPFVQGDGPQWVAGNPESTMLSIYGSGHVGFFGGIIDSTNVPMILKIDCVKADFFPEKTSYPTYLYYNPHSKKQNVTIDLGKEKVDVYDKVSATFLMKNVNLQQSFLIEPSSSRLLVLIPAGKKYTTNNGNLIAADIVVDYKYN